MKQYTQIYRRALPLSFANMSLAALVFTDMAMLGQHDLSAMAAGSIMMQVYLIVLVVGEGVVFGFSPVYGRHHSDPNSDRHVQVIATTIWIIALFSLGGFIILSQAGWLAQGFISSTEFSPDAQAYVLLLGAALLPNLLFILFWELLAFEEKEALVLAGAVTQLGVNALANYALIYGNFGFPSLGLVGAGIATVVSSSCATIIMATACLRNVPDLRSLSQSAFCSIAQQYRTGLQILRVGLPFGLTIMATIGFLSLSLFLMTRFGTQAVVAHSAVMQVSEIVVLFALGFGDYAAIRFASIRAFSGRAARAELLLILKAGLLLFVPLITVATLLRDFLAFVFFNQGDPSFLAVQEQLSVFAAISIPSLIISFVLMVLQGSLRGLGVTTKPAILIFGCYWCFAVPLQFILLQAYDAKPTVIWVGLVTGFLFATLCLAFFWKRFLPNERIEEA
tara:strand:+ start:1578 stop:2927 length:1350 start_codon:yes stop_codon:yes gene_type:complete